MSNANRTGNGGGGGNGKKRKYHEWKQYHRNPRRGGPGFLMTCETGREMKCQREGIDILNHYCSVSKSMPKIKSSSDTKSLSLDDELKMLKSKEGNRSDKFQAKSNFSVYDTGIRGSAFVICTQPGCNMIPPIKVDDGFIVRNQEQTNNERIESDDGNDKDKTQPKKARGEEGDINPARKYEDAPGLGVDGSIEWDPVKTFRQILSDIKENSTSAPSSRFITRMIPMQATCYASVEEIRLTSKGLLSKLFDPMAHKTFAISSKRRNCANVSRQQIIDTIADIVIEMSSTCKTDLKNPDVTIVVEICKTLCGISVISSCSELFNFSLVAARESVVSKESDDEH